MNHPLKPNRAGKGCDCTCTCAESQAQKRMRTHSKESKAMVESKDNGRARYWVAYTLTEEHALSLNRTQNQAIVPEQNVNGNNPPNENNESQNSKYDNALFGKQVEAECEVV